MPAFDPKPNSALRRLKSEALHRPGYEAANAHTHRAIERPDQRRFSPVRLVDDGVVGYVNPLGFHVGGASHRARSPQALSARGHGNGWLPVISQSTSDKCIASLPS